MSETVIITGCASGIGKQLADELYRRGNRILATDVNEDGLRAVAAHLGWKDPNRIELRRLDVRNAVQWDDVVNTAVEKWGKLDRLMNVAGVLRAVWSYEATPQDVDFHIDINTKGLMYGTNAALRRMVAQRSGHVINVASMAGVIPVPGNAIYSASKHAARAYSVAVAQEVRKFNVFVSVVCPTVVETPMMDVQIGKEEAAMTFSASRALRVDEVTDAIVQKVMTKKPIQTIVDVPGTFQGVLSQIGNLMPEVSAKMSPKLMETGKKFQKKLATSKA